jgi:hypothetical protein
VTVACQGRSLIGKSGGMNQVVHLVEERVFTALDDGDEKRSCQWVLDTGASNHMLGSRAAFSGIDGRTIRTVKFVDGSVVYIEGVGTVLYQCRNGEHRVL